MTPILQDIYVVEVPEDLQDYHLNDFGISGKSLMCFTDSQNFIPNIIVENAKNCTILGTVSPTEIDFNCEDLVKSEMPKTNWTVDIEAGRLFHQLLTIPSAPY